MIMNMFGGFICGGLCVKHVNILFRLNTTLDSIKLREIMTVGQDYTKRK